MMIPRAAYFKLALVVIATAIVVTTLYYTSILVRELLERETEIASLYARSLEFVANQPPGNPGEQGDYGFIFDEIIQSIDFPMVLTDNTHTPASPFAASVRNIPLDSTLSDAEALAYLRGVIEDLDRVHAPIRVTLADSLVLNYVHYGESRLIGRLRWLPYVEIAVAGMFILLGYIGFSYIKRNEQGNIWVGMARETAHQLGTPVSSLMGWIEMMKMQAAGHERQLGTLAEMENDILRLQKIAERFSKIGSKPSLKEEDLREVIEGVIGYFKKRLPSRVGGNRRIEFLVRAEGPTTAHINRELFEWVIENLIKNAVDAIDTDGLIGFDITAGPDAVIVDASDTGRGIDMKDRKDIFRPGFTTKQRGWGLGLSLSRRIVETYHRGKLAIRESRPGRGTTFRIRLPRRRNP